MLMGVNGLSVMDGKLTVGNLGDLSAGLANVKPGQVVAVGLESKALSLFGAEGARAVFDGVEPDYRRISGSSQLLRGENEQEIRNIEGRGRQAGQRDHAQDAQALLGGTENQDRAGRPARRGQHFRAVPP